MSSQRNSSISPSGPPRARTGGYTTRTHPGLAVGRAARSRSPVGWKAMPCHARPILAMQSVTTTATPANPGRARRPRHPSPPQVQTGLSEATGDRGDRRQLATVGTQDRLSILPCAACAAPRDGGESASVPRGSGATAFGWMLSSGCGPCCGLSSRMGWWCLASNRVGGEVGLGVWRR